MSDQAEIRVIEEFKKMFHAFPEGKISKCESPDFIVDTLSGTLGVEISEVFQDSHKGKSILQERSSISSKFAEDLIQKVQSHLPFTFTIIVQLSSSNFIKQHQRENLLNELMNLCVNALGQAKNKEFIKIEGLRILPKEKNRIYLCRYDDLKVSVNNQAEGGIKSNLLNDHIKPIIAKKDRVIGRYQKCDDYWLIIKEGNYYAGSFGEIELLLPIESKFNKLFLYRSAISQVIQLK
jgi:hypothetical protein